MASRSDQFRLSVIVYVLRELWANWYDVGVQLDVPSERLDCIQNENTSEQARFTRIIQWWLLNGAHLRWSTLADVIKRVTGHGKLVIEVQKRDKQTKYLDYTHKRRRASQQNDSDDEPAASKPQAKMGCLDNKNTGATNLVEPQLPPFVNSYCSSMSAHATVTQPSDIPPPAVSNSSDPKFNSKSLVKERFLELAKNFTQKEAQTSDIDDPNDKTCGKADLVCVHYCGCGNHCTLDKLSTGGCLELIKRKVHVVNALVQEPTEIATTAVVAVDLFYHEKITADIQSLYGAFVTDTACSFNSREEVTIQQLALYLPKAFQSMQSKEDELDKASCMMGVFKAIPSPWHQYDVIKGMIKYVGDGSDNNRLQVYECCVKEYTRRKLSPKRMKYIISGGSIPTEGEQVFVEIFDEKPTFCRVDRINGTILLQCQYIVKQRRPQPSFTQLSEWTNHQPIT